MSLLTVRCVMISRAWRCWLQYIEGLGNLHAWPASRGLLLATHIASVLFSILSDGKKSSLDRADVFVE